MSSPRTKQLMGKVTDNRPRGLSLWPPSPRGPGRTTDRIWGSRPSGGKAGIVMKVPGRPLPRMLRTTIANVASHWWRMGPRGNWGAPRSAGGRHAPAETGKLLPGLPSLNGMLRRLQRSPSEQLPWFYQDATDGGSSYMPLSEVTVRAIPGIETAPGRPSSARVP